MNKLLIGLSMLLVSGGVSAQGFTLKQDVIRANSNSVAYVHMKTQNFNTYKQQYKISVNGEFKDGVLRLHPNQKRLIRVKLTQKGFNKICMYSIPKSKQNRVIALCDTVLVK